jgi:hypothetical protein
MHAALKHLLRIRAGHPGRNHARRRTEEYSRRKTSTDDAAADADAARGLNRRPAHTEDSRRELCHMHPTEVYRIFARTTDSGSTDRRHRQQHTNAQEHGT